ncbi:MAG TPA: bifunctional glutamate N-acetyltransferase/amino-acid acetyltransferase ArgJ [Bryobacteraceae bacterium]|nr:bifunctional glutamate N-acetyltransferase/amino-acid acetyltransferase ArgJ [Bryobacteraceae bacterium]
MKLPLGYRYSSTYAGIRKDKRDDLAIIASDAPASAAAVFTTNRVQAAPVRLARNHLKATGGEARAILANAGNANCATRTGMRVAAACCRAAAKELKSPMTQVLPASTGVIGVEMDASLVTGSLPALFKGLSETRFEDVSRAIMTTDRIPKVAFGEVPFNHGMARIAGMTKGAGMIHPRMATTLGFVMTDAEIEPGPLARMLRHSTERSFNRLSVDGDMSTNDTLILLANGASGLRPTSKERMVFEEVLCWVMQDLAEMIARDGEGANKKVTVHVVGAKDDKAATQIARAIANSPLVKTAIAGSDPNWGRILSAAGASGVEFDPDKVDILLQGVPVCRRGLAAEFSELELKKKLDTSDCVIRFAIRGQGRGETCFWTCDLTEGYIRINASYRT